MSSNIKNWKKVFDDDALKAFEANNKLYALKTSTLIIYEIQRYLFINDKLDIGNILIQYNDRKQLYQIIVNNELYLDDVEYSNLYNDIRDICNKLLSEFDI